MAIEWRLYTHQKGMHWMGRSYVWITCPFCATVVKAYMAESEKRCPTCGAVHCGYHHSSRREVPDEIP